MSFFNSLGQRVGYGAIMYNGNPDGMASCYPVFTSQVNFTALTSISSSGMGTISINDVDDYWTVMPGYKLEVYAGAWYSVGILLTADNTNGVVPVNYKPSANQASSLKLYFKGTLIEQPGTFALFNGSAVKVSNYMNTYDILYGSTYYHVYEFFEGSIGTLSFTGSNTVSNIQCLLIGGGGGGGMYNVSGATAAGAGGAGTFLTTSFSAIPGSTFTVTVGAGGAGAAASTTNPGTFGSTTSITRSYNNVVDNTLTAGGGGGGGALNDTNGTIGTIYGSTGGTGGMNVAGVTNATAASTAAGTAYTVTGSVFTTISAYTNIGGNSSNTGGGGGGGGAGSAGQDRASNYPGGNGGNGKAWTVTGSSRLFAGGGGGVNSTLNGPAGLAGSGGGGSFANPVVGVTENTGSGGASAYSTIAAGKGANGICIIAIPV